MALNSELQSVQILTNDAQVLILCLSYFVTTVCIWNIGPQKIKSLIGHASIGRNQNKNSVELG